jgi:acyl carrier protein
MTDQPQTINIDDVIRALQRVLRDRRRRGVTVQPATRLDELGFDSLDVAEIFLAIEEEVGFRLDSERVPDLVVVSDFAGLEPLNALGA